MEFIGDYIGAKERDGGLIIAFKVRPTEIGLNENTPYNIEVTKQRQKRSNNANAYYQEITTKIANEMGISTTEYHNRALAELGIYWRDENGKRDYILHLDNDFWLKCLKGENHYAPTGKTEEKKNGTYRWFVRMKPSREFDTKEMSMLLDYVIQDAETCGIKVLSKEELKEMKNDWKR